MKTSDLKEFANKIKGKISFDYDIQKLNWFNIGGKTKIFFKPESLEELINFLKIYNKRGKIFVLGAGSNTLFSDKIYDGVVIKLGRIFSNISLLNNNLIIAGSAVTDKKLSEFAKDNSIGGFEFLSCIPGSIGGGIRMNAGCFDGEFKNLLISVQAVDFLGNILTIPSEKIKFNYRGSNLPKDLIFLSASFKGAISEKVNIQKLINELKKRKEQAQPSKIKTGGSTFKNPIDQTNEKVWKLIRESVSKDVKFGDAAISDKHSNFFINQKSATFNEMKELIEYVRQQVKTKTGIKLDLEIVLVE